MERQRRASRPTRREDAGAGTGAAALRALAVAAFAVLAAAPGPARGCPLAGGTPVAGRASAAGDGGGDEGDAAHSAGAVVQRPLRRGLKGNPVPLPDSAALIEGALARGEIDADTALKYRVLALFADERLPAAYRGDDRHVFESTALEELNERFDSLTTADQELLGPFLMRPASVGSWLDPGAAAAASARRSSATVLRGRPACRGVMADWASIATPVARVRVWYDTTKTGHAGVAAAVAQDIEANAWPALTVTAGFKQPLDDTSLFGCDGGDDRLDVYVVDGMAARGLTVPEGLAFFQAATYIMVKSTLAQVVREHTVTHELMHAIQWAYRMASSQKSYGWLRDAMANWAVDLSHPGNPSLQEMATCYTESPGLRLDDRSTGHCPQGARIERDYGAYLFFQFIARTSSPATVRQALQATTAHGTSLAAVNSAIPGGFATQWPRFAKTLWNRAPVDAKPASFRMWDGQPAEPVLADDLPQPTPADLNGAPSATTELEPKLANLTIRYYQLTFSDPGTRSLMFHNGFYENRQRGEKVDVQAMWKPAGRPWVEEDWGNFEWIGLCRDGKAQRVEQLVVVVSSAEWSAPGSYPIVAVATPALERNNIGCWGFEGSAGRTLRSAAWSGGQIAVTAQPRFTLHPTGQYTDAGEGRLRVPIAAPLFAGAHVALTEAYSAGGCSYSAQFAASTGTITQGGDSAGSLVIRYFRDAEPGWLRASQDQLLGTAPRAYFAEGQTQRVVLGAVTGGEDCGASYETQPSAWLLTSEGTSSPRLVRSDGRLEGTRQTQAGGDTNTWTWNLAPVREP